MALRLNGEVSLTWNIPEEALKQELVGVSEAGQFNEIFQRYSSISRAEARFSPSWIRMAAKSPERIIIEYSGQ